LSLTIFNYYIEYLTEEAHEGPGIFKIRRQVIARHRGYNTISNDAKSTSEIKHSIALSKAAFNKPKSISPENWTKI
jgi:hypothetical protein